MKIQAICKFVGKFVEWEQEFQKYLVFMDIMNGFEKYKGGKGRKGEEGRECDVKIKNIPNVK